MLSIFLLSFYDDVLFVLLPLSVDIISVCDCSINDMDKMCDSHP